MKQNLRSRLKEWREYANTLFSRAQKILADHKGLALDLGVTGAFAITTHLLYSPWTALPLTGGGGLLFATVRRSIVDVIRKQTKPLKAALYVGLSTLIAAGGVLCSYELHETIGPGEECPPCVVRGAFRFKIPELGNTYAVPANKKIIKMTVKRIAHYHDVYLPDTHVYKNHEIFFIVETPVADFFTGKEIIKRKEVSLERMGRYIAPDPSP